MIFMKKSQIGSVEDQYGTLVKNISTKDLADMLTILYSEPEIAIYNADFDQYRFPNSIFQMVLREKYSNVSLEYILGLINSKLIRAYYSLSAQVEGTTKPQIYINLLKSVPILLANKKDQEVVTQKVRQIMKLKRDSKNNEEKTKAIELEKEIDSLVMDLYGLTNEERAEIDKSINQ